MSPIEKGLNIRQWKLYKYLKRHKDEWKKLDDVIAETDLYNDSDGYRLLKADIRALRNREIIQTLFLPKFGALIPTTLISLKDNTHLEKGKKLRGKTIKEINMKGEYE